jgi:hypothetical protein
MDQVEMKIAAYLARREKEMEDEPEESRSDLSAYEAVLYRDMWNSTYSRQVYGSYEDTSKHSTPIRITYALHC